MKYQSLGQMTEIQLGTGAGTTTFSGQLEKGTGSPSVCWCSWHLKPLTSSQENSQRAGLGAAGEQRQGLPGNH